MTKDKDGGLFFLIPGAILLLYSVFVFVNASDCEGTYYTKIDNLGVTIDESICSSHSMGSLCHEMRECKESIFSWRRIPVIALTISIFLLWTGFSIRYDLE